MISEMLSRIFAACPSADGSAQREAASFARPLAGGTACPIKNGYVINF
jgi:hypothetical protein